MGPEHLFYFNKTVAQDQSVHFHFNKTVTWDQSIYFHFNKIVAQDQSVHFHFNKTVARDQSIYFHLNKTVTWDQSFFFFFDLFGTHHVHRITHESLIMTYFQCGPLMTCGGLEWEVESTTVTHSSADWGIFYFPWHRHQIEGTNSCYCLIRKTLASGVNVIAKVPKRKVVTEVGLEPSNVQ